LVKEISNFTSAIELDLYFKAQTNNYLSFTLKEFMLQRSYEQGRLLNCICDDHVLMNFLSPYFKEATTLDLFEGTRNWFKNPAAKFSFSRRSLTYLKSFKSGYFDCVAIRLSYEHLPFENFKRAVEVFKKVAKSLIIIEDNRLGTNHQNNKFRHTQYLSACNHFIESYFTPVSSVNMYKWNFKCLENKTYQDIL